MDVLGFVLYSAGVLVFYVVIVGGSYVMAWIIENWDVVTLLVTNVGALFVKPPGRK